MSITATRLANGNLLITADNEARAEIADAMRDPHKCYWGIMADQFESYACNGSYTHFDAGQADPFVGLTSAPCIAESMSYDDDGNAEIDGDFWFFADYMIRDDLSELRNKGRVVYTLATATE